MEKPTSSTISYFRPRLYAHYSLNKTKDPLEFLRLRITRKMYIKYTDWTQTVAYLLHNDTKKKKSGNRF